MAVITTVNGNLMKNMAKDAWFMQTGLNLKEIILETKGKDQVNLFSQTEIESKLVGKII